MKLLSDKLHLFIEWPIHSTSSSTYDKLLDEMCGIILTKNLPLRIDCSPFLLDKFRFMTAFPEKKQILFRSVVSMND